MQARRAHGKSKANTAVQAMAVDDISQSQHNEDHSNSDIPDSALVVKQFKKQSDARNNPLARIHAGQKS
jgi:hypothetical protein